MAELYRLYTEADYDATTKVTGVNQAQAWDPASQLGGGGSGDIRFTTAGSSGVYCYGAHDVVTGGFYQYSGYIDLTNYSITLNSELCLLHYATSSGGTSRSGLFAQQVSDVDVLMHRIQQDSGNVQIENFTLPSQAFQYNVVIKKSSSAMTADAWQKVYIDGVLASTKENITIYNVFDYARAKIGPFSVGPTNAGYVLIGKIRVTDTEDLIGPYVSYNARAFSQLRRRRRD